MKTVFDDILLSNEYKFYHQSAVTYIFTENLVNNTCSRYCFFLIPHIIIIIYNY